MRSNPQFYVSSNNSVAVLSNEESLDLQKTGTKVISENAGRFCLNSYAAIDSKILADNLYGEVSCWMVLIDRGKLACVMLVPALGWKKVLSLFCLLGSALERISTNFV